MVDEDEYQEHEVTIWITLPSGDEEVLEKLPVRFIEKPLLDTVRNVNKSKEKENDGSSRSNDTSNVELEYPLSKLVALVKKQGYPVEGSFVSYYSANF